MKNVAVTSDELEEILICEIHLRHRKKSLNEQVMTSVQKHCIINYLNSTK